MAKEKEEKLIDLPEFNEKDFLIKEKTRAKAVVIFFLLGAALGLFSGVLYVNGMWYFSVLIVFFFLLFLRIIVRSLKLEMPETTGQKFFLIMEFILTWIVFWIIFLNPPLSTISGPQVSNLEVHWNNAWSAVSQISPSVYAWYPHNVSYRLYVYYLYPITNITINYYLYNGPPGTAGIFALRSLSNVAHHYAGHELYFNLTGRFMPVSGNYLEIQVITQSHGHSYTDKFYLTLYH